MSEVEHAIQSYREQTPVRVESLIRALGIELEEDAELKADISGQIQRTASGGYIIRTNRREHSYRRRFTMAHELGHYVLHKTILDQVGGINDSTLFRTDKMSALYNSHIDLIHERQANSFAANLLMPDESVRKHYDGHSSIYNTFQVSPSAMKWKLKNLGLEA